MTNKRVSVDAKALYDFIQSARTDHESCISEYSSSVNEANFERKQFDKGVARLDPKEVTE